MLGLHQNISIRILQIALLLLPFVQTSAARIANRGDGRSKTARLWRLITASEPRTAEDFLSDVDERIDERLEGESTGDDNGERRPNKEPDVEEDCHGYALGKIENVGDQSAKFTGNTTICYVSTTFRSSNKTRKGNFDLHQTKPEQWYKPPALTSCDL